MRVMYIIPDIGFQIRQRPYSGPPSSLSVERKFGNDVRHYSYELIEQGQDIREMEIDGKSEFVEVFHFRRTN